LPTPTTVKFQFDTFSSDPSGGGRGGGAVWTTPGGAESPENGNFGWIAVTRDGFNLSTTGWAYETEPGVPIDAGQVPVGGTAPILGLGLLFRRSRKRKR